MKGRGEGRTVHKKGQNFLHRTPLPHLVVLFEQLPLQWYQNMPTDNWEILFHSSCNALSLLLSLSPSPSRFLSLSASALYSLLAIKHWAAINKLANHFQPSPKLYSRTPGCCYRDSYRLLLFSFCFRFFFSSLSSPPFCSPFLLKCGRGEWCLCL